MTELTENGGGELYRVGAIKGWNFNKGSATLSAQYSVREALTVGDRDFLKCSEPGYTDAAGNNIDREDRSITANESFSQCQGLYYNTFIDQFTGERYIPSPDGVTTNPDFPGYRPRTNGRYTDDDVAYYEDVLHDDFLDAEHALNKQERLNVYATLDYNFDFWGGVDLDADFLYSNRETNSANFRQFFPSIGGSDCQFFGFCEPYTDDPDYHNGLSLTLPVMPYTSNSNIEIDYYYITAGLSGILPTEKYWSWRVYSSYSYSDGDYSRNEILISKSADVFRGGTTAPPVDFFDPSILNGDSMAALIGAIGGDSTGNTIYDQFTLTAVLAGDLFDMPAGTLGAAFGAEYRTFSINDVPDLTSQNGENWGSSSALVTKGTNDVIEAFVEAEIPLLAGIPMIEELSVNVSARAFDYKDGGSDTVWKAGLRWNLTPTIMLRSTAGSSYRAPALFEQYLGNETAFTGQLAIDPCIDWSNNSNELIRRNCAADGIPASYQGTPSSSATVISGGGAATLEPETSDAFTVGLVWTPEFSDLSIALDYIDIKVENQISQLGAGAIVSGCYAADNFPNTFCDRFERKPGNDPSFPYNISSVNDTFINVNNQVYKGVDLNMVWNHGLSFGQLEVALQSTWNLENIQELFNPDEIQGFDTTDFVGTIGSPKNTSNLRTTVGWQDWRFNYFVQYVSETDNSPFANEETTYFDFAPAFRDITMDKAFFHNISAIYAQDKWNLLVGINNLLDEEPDTVSDASATNKVGNIPIEASQYDMLGRRYYVRFNYTF